MRLRTRAQIEASTGDLVHALELASSACPLSEGDREDESTCLALVGDLHLRRLDFARARQSHEAAIAIAEPGLGATGPVLADSLTGLGESLLGLGDLAGASDRLGRARELQAAHAGEPASAARTLFALARVTWARGDESDAQQLARRAWTLVRDSEGGQARAREVEAWLATRGGL